VSVRRSGRELPTRGPSDFSEAARSIGPPLYVVRGLQPVKLNGSGRSGDEFTSVSLTCGTTNAVSIEIQVDHSLPSSWSLLRTMPLDEAPNFPLIFEQVETSIEVDGKRRDITIVTNGPRWAGMLEVDGRWIGIDSRSVTIEDVALVPADIATLG
jgi:hypothetical protein